MRVAARWAAICALTTAALLASRTGSAQDNGIGDVWRDTFEDGIVGWAAYGPSAKAALTVDPVHVKNGKGAIEFSFTLARKGDPNAISNAGDLPVAALVRNTSGGQLTKMRSLRFWARPDDDTAVAVMLSEKEGGHYVTIVWLPRDVWTRVRLDPGDFWLSDGPGEPKDPDGKLDLDQVESIGIISFWSVHAAGSSGNAMLASLIAPHLGAHTIWLDDVTASAEPLGAPPANGDPNGAWIDAFDRDALPWYEFGADHLTLDPNAPTRTRALKLDYVEAAGEPVFIAKELRTFVPNGADSITFPVASVKPIKLAITLEELNGAKYQTLVDVDGGSATTTVRVPLSHLTLADDSPPDPAGKLDAGKLKTLTLVDMSGLSGAGSGKNSLWIGPIRAAVTK